MTALFNATKGNNNGDSKKNGKPSKKFACYNCKGNHKVSECPGCFVCK